MDLKQSLSTTKYLFVFALLFSLSGFASADIIDDINMKADANGELDAVIRFTIPVQYVRSFPHDKSANLSVYFNVLGNVPRDEWQNYESHRAPKSDLIRGITVSTRDLQTGPKIQVQFSQPVEFSVGPGRDSQSILIHINPGSAQQKSDTKPTTGLPVAIPVVPVIAPVVTPALPVVPATVTPPVAPVAAKSVAVPASIQPAPKPAPAVVVPAPSLAPVSGASPAPLGGKDGLPSFPVIQQADMAAAIKPPTDNMTLAERSKRADAQSAQLMAKGRDKLLAGEMFAAIDAFNSALNLPPNKYSADAQVWIGIAREKGGQLAKAKAEYDTYLKLYPNEKDAQWIKARLAKLQAIQPMVPLASQQSGAAKPQGNEWQTTQYGSVSSYYYFGNSQTDTVATIGGVDTATRLTAVDQRTLIGNVSVTARAYNNEFDNRLVFQDFESVNFLKNQGNQNRLNAAYFEVKNRAQNYSVRIGRQSALGGGVLGRFDGVSGGYGFSPDWRLNLVAGRLSDITADAKPVFKGANLDFGMRSAIGGSAYYIVQTIDGITDRKAVGGNMRYFEQGKTAMAMLDYDLQFKDLNMLTVQGTLSRESGTDFNFLVDRRKTPSLSIMSSVTGGSHIWGVPDPGTGTNPATGTPFLDANGQPIPATFTTFAAMSSVKELLANGWTTADLIDLAKKRTAVSNVAQIGMTNRIKEKWQLGTDLVVTNTSGMPESGTLNPDGTTGLEGYVAATPFTGNAWTISERLSGTDVISLRDITMGSLSYTKSKFMTGEMLVLYNHAYIRELWTLDSSVRLSWQTDSTGGKVRTTAPVFRVGYRMKSNLTLEGEGGVDWSTITPSTWAPSKTIRKYLSLGFRWDF